MISKLDKISTIQKHSTENWSSVLDSKSFSNGLHEMFPHVPTEVTVGSITETAVRKSIKNKVELLKHRRIFTICGEARYAINII